MANKNGTKDNLYELKKRALKIKKDSSLRHTPNDHDKKKVSENATLMQIPQETVIGAQ